MTKFTATFSAGRKLTRTSAKQYLGAYIVTVDGGKKVIASGFSATKEAAEKIAAREVAAQLKGDFGNADGLYKTRGPAYEVVSTAAVSDLGVTVGRMFGL